LWGKECDGFLGAKRNRFDRIVHFQRGLFMIAGQFSVVLEWRACAWNHAVTEQ
jgi:uncharacterized membrane protein YjdF